MRYNYAKTLNGAIVLEQQTEKKGLNISAKSFITAIVVIFALMVLTYVLTFIIPGGEYVRILDTNGYEVVDPSQFQYTDGGISFVKWLLSPILVLTAEGNGTLIAVLVFLLVIGGIFTSLDHCGLMSYMLGRIVSKFGHAKYKLMAIVVLFFMALGSLIGSFEECVPLVPIVTALSASLGWDAITGLGMSILAAGCGFAAGICNPFTVGVAQELAGLPMFSGMWLRCVAFVLIYGLLMAFLVRHAKRVEKESLETAGDGAFVPRPEMDRGLWCFAGILGAGILLVMLSGLIPALQDFTMIIVAVMFFVAGIVSTLVSGMRPGDLAKTFLQGIKSILPAVVMILMASSIKYTLVEASILDTLLHEMVRIAEDLPKSIVILFIYLVVLVLNFFISSGSAKAFLLMPLIVPVAQVFGISSQLCVMAFAFGDGFSNVIYPTNPVLLISLGLVDVSYGKWFKWSVKFQLLNLLLTSALLMVGLMIGY